MNNPLNAPSSQNELILRLIGGERDGQMFTVHNEKCLLSGLLPKTEDAEKYRCAIFRGEKGVAFRSYSDHVLCNGAKVSVKWLKQGDLIKLTDSFSVEVIQLGVYSKSAPETPAAPPIGTRSPTQTISLGADQHPYENATPAKITPVATQLVGAVDSPAVEPRKFKPATNNLRTPSVTAPLDAHQPLVPTSEPASRTPAHTQPFVTAADTVVTTGNAGDSASTSMPVEPVAVAPSTMGSEIDSLTDRLSKLVDAASGDEETPAVASQSAPLESDDVQINQTEAQVVSASVQLSDMPQVEVPGISDSPEAPVVETVDSGSLTTPDPQPSSSDDPASRRSALESFFAKSGVSIADAPPVEDVAAPVPNPASPVPGSEPVEAIAVPTTSEPEVRQSVVTEGVAKTSDFDLDSVLAKLEASAANAKPASEVSDLASDVTSTMADPVGLQGLLPSEATPSAPNAPQPGSDVETYTGPLNEPSVVAPPVAQTPVFQTPVNEASVTEASVSDAFAVPMLGVNGLEASGGEAAVKQPYGGETNDSETIADNPTASAESSGESPIQSFALLQSLGLDTTGLSDMKKEIAQSPAPEELAAIVSPIDQAEEPEPVAQQEPVESVADVLARMQSGGSLDDFNMGDAPAEAEPQPDVLPVPPVEAFVSQPSVANEIDAPGEEEDGSVEDYMSQLLNRMRGEEEPTTGQVVTEKQDDAVEKIVAEKAAVESVKVEPKIASTQTLTQEEFIPKQKPVRMQSLDSLREIANSSAREAFRDSIAKERTISTQTKLTIALISLAFAVLFFAMSYMMQDKVNVWGVVCGIGFLVFGILTSRAYLSEKKLDESIISD